MNKDIVVKLLLDSVKYNQKPTSKEEITSICKRLNNTNPTEITVKELIKEITYPNGKSFCPATFNGNRKNENWCSQQIFVLDFDSKISLEIVLKRLNEYGLDCTAAYSTFNDTPEHPKFRVMWQLENVISDQVSREEIQTALMLLFPECDQACKDASRMYFGGKKVIYENYKYTLDLPLLIDGVKCFKVNHIKSSNITKKLKSLDKKIGKSEKWMKSGNSYIYNIEDSIFNPKNDKNNTTLIKVDFEKLRKKIKILDDFMNGEWLYHMELFGLATNLIHINGGTKLFKQCLDSNPNYSSDKYNLPAIVKFYDYNPMSLKFSPYEEDKNYKNLLQAAKIRKGVVRLKQHKTISLNQAETMFKQKFQEAFASPDTDIHVFKISTGLGKTEECVNLENVTLAYPNHSLKDEVFIERFKADCLVTPSLPEDIPDHIKEKLNYYYSIGAIQEANRFLCNESVNYPQLLDYHQKNLTCYNAKQTVITTHQKALFVNFENHHTLIFDEDPLMNSILPIDKVTINDFIRLKKYLEDPDDINVIDSYLNYINTALLNSPIETKIVRFKNYDVLEKIVLQNQHKWDGNILQFFNSDFFVVDSRDPAQIHFITKNKLPQDKKIIILSATVDQFIYERLFKDRIKFYDLSNIELTGMINQDYSYSFSRQSLKENLDYAIEKANTLPTITFVNYKHHFKNAVKDCHFGKATGFDKLKNQNIAVVGLPHANPITHLLYAQVLGLKFKSIDFKMCYQVVQHNDLEFSIQTYDNQDLRKLQFFFIESELRQAVGRARALREPATVLLLSGYPLPEACLTDEEKTREEFRVNQIKENKSKLEK